MVYFIKKIFEINIIFKKKRLKQQNIRIQFLKDNVNYLIKISLTNSTKK